MKPAWGLHQGLHSAPSPTGMSPSPLGTEGCRDPRLWADGLNTLGLVWPLLLNCQSLKRLFCDGTEEVCTRCDSWQLHTSVEMLAGSGLSILPAAYHRPALATGTVHNQSQAVGQREGGQPNLKAIWRLWEGSLCRPPAPGMRGPTWCTLHCVHRDALAANKARILCLPALKMKLLGRYLKTLLSGSILTHFILMCFFFFSFLSSLLLYACRHRPDGLHAQLTPSHLLGSLASVLQHHFRASLPCKTLCVQACHTDWTLPGSPIQALPTIIPWDRVLRPQLQCTSHENPAVSHKI